MPKSPFFARVIRKRAVVLLSLAAVLAVTGWYWLSPASRTGQAPLPTPPPIPVEIAAASRADVPIYLTGLGTVQAFNTITVTTRVDGQLQTMKFVEGQDVKVGDTLAQIDPRPFQAALDQAVATKAKDEAQLENAKLDLQRYATLAPQNYTSKQIFDTQRALVAQLDAQVKMDQAAIDLATANLDYTTIKSPIDGRTGIRLMDAGNNLLTTANTPIVVVTQMKPISVIFTLPEEDLPAVRKSAATGPVSVIAFSRDQKTELDRGTVAVLDNEILQSTGTIRIKATFPNEKESLWPGDFVNAQLLSETQHNVLTIPSPAVQRGPNGLYAYVVKPDSTVEMRSLKLDQFAGGQAIIDGGLQLGERVVTAGQYRLQPGARVQSSKSNVTSAAPDQAAAPGELQ
ncbi:MAG: efflux transporter periplasmic adaptor subunit [Rhodospirillales bacterium]|nr:efflux transporter periplasmic adaptor subunit [Rhodospirillales bacterium]